MAFAHKVNRVTMSGTMYNGGEIWTTGFYAGSNSGDAPAPTDDMAEVIALAWEPFFESASVKVGYLFKTATIKITPISAAGVIDIPGIKSYSYATPIQGAHVGNGHPPQCAMVATLVAGNGVGNGGKGRMYLPGIGSDIDTTGHITTGDANSIASSLATFFSTVNGSVDNPGTAINAAKTSAVTGMLAINRVLTTVKVGNVFDTQRRRRNALAETYSSDAI